jgi:Domain of unknown function (DUF4062)
MARRVLDVFLSSTAVDLAVYRAAVRERLMRTGLFHCVCQEDFGAQESSAVDYCRQAVQKADLFVGLIGLRRGWEPDSDNGKRSITEIEHDWAMEAGRRRFLWVAPDDLPVPGNLRESDEQHSRQAAFRRRVMDAGQCIVSQKDFGSPELLASEIANHLLTQAMTRDLFAPMRSKAARHEPRLDEEQVPTFGAAVEIPANSEIPADSKDVVLLARANESKVIDTAVVEGQLRTGTQASGAEGSAEYVHALACMHRITEVWVAYTEVAAALNYKALLLSGSIEGTAEQMCRNWLLQASVLNRLLDCANRQAVA